MAHPRFSIYKSRATKCIKSILIDTDPKLPTDFAKTIVQLYGTTFPIKIDPENALPSTHSSQHSLDCASLTFQNATTIPSSLLVDLFGHLQTFLVSSKTKVQILRPFIDIELIFFFLSA